MEQINETEIITRKKKSPARLYIILGFILIIWLIITHYINFVIVYGQSMENTLHEWDWILIEKQSYKTAEDVNRFDIVVSEGKGDYKGLLLIKRVVGLPGDQLEVKDGILYINNDPVPDIYGREPIEDPGILFQPYFVPSDHIFIMGDNRNYSSDSREFGAVSVQEIRGKCVRYLFNPHGNRMDPFKKL